VSAGWSILNGQSSLLVARFTFREHTLKATFEHLDVIGEEVFGGLSHSFHVLSLEQPSILHRQSEEVLLLIVLLTTTFARRHNLSTTLYLRDYMLLVSLQLDHSHLELHIIYFVCRVMLLINCQLRCRNAYLI